jgi:translation initiation factor IF-1
MVKNLQGGNKHKSQARKNVMNSNRTSSKLRISENEYELYAQVSKSLGNGMVYVSTLQGVQLLCIIRGKFKDKGKRDNYLKVGSWVLVGLREWESGSLENVNKKTSKITKCDLLEVYSEYDKDKLKNTVHENWKAFMENNVQTNNKSIDEMEEFIQFSNQDQEEYKKLIEESLKEENILGKKTSITLQPINEDNNIQNVINELEDEIDIDDI